MVGLSTLASRSAPGGIVQEPTSYHDHVEPFLDALPLVNQVQTNSSHFVRADPLVKHPLIVDFHCLLLDIDTKYRLAFRCQTLRDGA